MLEIGKVYKVKKNGFATVRFERKTACEHCNMCMKPRDEMYVELKLKNTLNASVGDKVSVTIGERAVLTASLIVYVMPLVVMGIVLACTYKLNIGVCLGASLGALALAFVLVAVIDKYIIKRNADYLPKMLAIITEKENIENTKNTEVQNGGDNN